MVDPPRSYVALQQWKVTNSKGNGNAHPDVHVFSYDALVLDAPPPPNGAAPANDAVSNPCVILDLPTATAFRNGVRHSRQSCRLGLETKVFPILSLHLDVLQTPSQLPLQPL